MIRNQWSRVIATLALSAVSLLSATAPAEPTDDPAAAAGAVYQGFPAAQNDGDLAVETVLLDSPNFHG